MNVAAKISKEAKKIADRTGRSFRVVQKELGRKYRNGGKISGVRKKKSTSKKRRIGKRASPSRRSHSRVGAVRPQNFKTTIATARHDIQAELGWKLAAQRTAKTKKEKKGMQPQINLLTRQLKALKA